MGLLLSSERTLVKNIVCGELLNKRLGNGRDRYRFAERIEDLDGVTDLSAISWVYIHNRR